MNEKRGSGRHPRDEAVSRVVGHGKSRGESRVPLTIYENTVAGCFKSHGEEVKVAKSRNGLWKYDASRWANREDPNPKNANPDKSFFKSELDYNYKGISPLRQSQWHISAGGEMGSYV